MAEDNRDIFDKVLEPELLFGAAAGAAGGRFLGKRAGRMFKKDAEHYGKQQRRFEKTEDTHLDKMHREDLSDEVRYDNWDDTSYQISKRHGMAESARAAAKKYAGKAAGALRSAATASNAGMGLGAAAGYSTAGSMKFGEKKR